MCIDRHENVVSDMVSPLYWFFYDSGKQIVYDVRHVAIQTVKEERRVLRDVFNMSKV
jgi:hypothetical protein